MEALKQRLEGFTVGGVHFLPGHLTGPTVSLVISGMCDGSAPIGIRRKALGKQGEDLAALHLLGEGYRVAVRNYRTAAGEIDIIAEKGGAVVFVEVKTSRSDAFGAPELRVTPSKQRRIAKIAARYLQNRGICEGDFRFDVVAVTISDSGPEISHMEGAFGV